MRQLVRAAACGLVGTVLVLCGSTSRVAAQEDEGLSIDQKILRTLGLRGGADIEYRERSPLVLPPRIDLPPPQGNAATAAPNWPVDPDVKRRREESTRRRDEVEESRVLRPSELNVGQPSRSRTPGANQDEMDGRQKQSSGFGFFGSMFGKKDESAQFTAEPPRTTLIEPPAGYQTPSPSQPYTARGEKWMPKIPSFWDFGSDPGR